VRASLFRPGPDFTDPTPLVVTAHLALWRRVAASVKGLCLVPLLSGCVLTAENPELGLDIPPAYQAAAATDAYASPPTLDWWGSFRSRELTDLMQQAQEANLDIAAAIARVTQADASARVTGAALLPTVDFNSSVSRSGSGAPTQDNVSGFTSLRRDQTNYSASLSAGYEIDFWGKNRASLRAAQENAIAARYAQDVVSITVLASAANSYFQILAAQDRLEIAQRNLSSALRVLDLIKQRLAVGTASELDTAQQESLVANVRANLPTLEQVLRQNKATLAVLVGKTPEAVTIKGGSLYRLAIPRITPGLPSDLLIQRPDIRQAEAALAAGSANVYVARTQFLPSIQLSAEGGYQSTVLRTLFTPQSQFYQLAAGLTQPIFQGGALIGNLEQQKGRQIELLQQYRLAILSGLADVENALVAVQQMARREQLQRDVVNSSRRAFDIAETRLREGTVDLVTTLQTQQTLFQAEDSLANVRLARMLAVVSLYQALGGGWTRTPLTRTASPLQ